VAFRQRQPLMEILDLVAAVPLIDKNFLTPYNLIASYQTGCKAARGNCGHGKI